MSNRILIAADIHTHPCFAGNQQCIMQYVEVLRKLGFEVYFLYIDLYEGYILYKKTRDYWGDHFFYYRTPVWQTILQKVLRRVYGCYYLPKLDVYYPFGLTRYVNGLHKRYDFKGLVVNYVWNSLLFKCAIPIKAIFTHDTFTDRNQKLGCKDAWYSFPEKEEAKGISRFQEVLSIQDEESMWFRKIAPRSHVRTVYSSFSFVRQPVTGEKRILFFSGGGKLNKEGIDRFIAEVWPLLKRQDNGVKLLLGGGICSCFKQEDLENDIMLKGKYDNPDDFYALGDICVNPVYNGSGLKIKTFEALAHGKLTIVAPHSALGVYQPDTIPLFRALCPDDYVNVICRYMGKKEELESQRKKCEVYINALNEYVLRQYTDIFGKSDK